LINRYLGLWRKLGMAAGLLLLPGLSPLTDVTHAAAAGVTRSVPSQYPTIQAAINASSDGDIVNVAPGSYFQTFQIVSKRVIVHGTGGTPADTVVQAPGQPVAMIQQTPFAGGYQAGISNLTIANGSGQSGQAGGLTLANGADAQITNVNIQGNRSAFPGGGVIINASNPVLTGVHVTSNTGCLGGGMLIVSSNPSISAGLFQNNTATDGGGAIWGDSNAHPIILNNTFTGNVANGTSCAGIAAFSTGGAIGLRTGVNAQVEGNTFSSNRAAYGAGLEMETQGGSVIVTANTFSGNTASGSPGNGGAIAAYNGTRGAIKFNNISGNTASTYGGGIVISENASLAVQDNIINGNTAGTDGGGLFVGGSGSAGAQLARDCIENNTVTNGNAGGIEVESGAAVTMSHDTIVSNSANHSSNYLPGGVQVRFSATSFSSSDDLFYANSGSNIFDELKNGSAVGTYARDVAQTLTPPPSGGDLASYDGSSPKDITAAGQFNSSPFGPNFTVATPTFNNSNPSDCTQPSSSPAAAAGVPNRPTPATEHIYRFYGTMKATHFFTASQGERNQVVGQQPVGWYQYEGIAFDGYNTQVTHAIPVYRFFQLSATGSHFYTASQAEADGLRANQTRYWQYEGIAFYVFPSGDATTEAGNLGPPLTVWRFLNLQSGSHFYTDNAGEMNYVRTSLTAQWRYEGAVFSVPNVG
jgi:predicted outer membrane repeat protein